MIDREVLGDVQAFDGALTPFGDVHIKDAVGDIDALDDLPFLAPLFQSVEITAPILADGFQSGCGVSKVSENPKLSASAKGLRTSNCSVTRM
jgi:hypothetical protein